MKTITLKPINGNLYNTRINWIRRNFVGCEIIDADVIGHTIKFEGKYFDVFTKENNEHYAVNA